MSQDDKIIAEIFEVLREKGPLDILDVADEVAPKCKVRLRTVEWMVRSLLERRQLKHDGDYRLLINEKSSKGARKTSAPLDRRRSAAATA